jgi:hypothetical protein
VPNLNFSGFLAQVTRFNSIYFAFWPSAELFLSISMRVYRILAWLAVRCMALRSWPIFCFEPGAMIRLREYGFSNYGCTRVSNSVHQKSFPWHAFLARFGLNRVPLEGLSRSGSSLSLGLSRFYYCCVNPVSLYFLIVSFHSALQFY